MADDNNNWPTGTPDQNVHPSGAAETKVPPCFTIEIQQDFALQYVGRQLVGSPHSFFFIDCQQGFEWSMNQ